MATTYRPGTLGADYANPATNFQKLKTRGHKFVVRYITGSQTSWKVLQKSERDAILKAGLGLILVFERSAERPLGGAAAGREDGLRANASCSFLEYPRWAPVIVAVDIDTTAANAAAVAAYWRAFDEACLWPCGVYGDWDAIELVKDRSVLNWQANARGWSFDWVRRLWKGAHPKAHVLQKRQTTDDAGTYDPNVVLRDFTAWSAGVPTKPPAAVIPPFAPEKGLFGLWPLAPNKPSIRRGNTGDAVRYAQGVMRKRGQDVKVDGLFGPRTEQAVKDRQRAELLPPTGIIDSATWKAIDRVA